MNSTIWSSLNRVVLLTFALLPATRMSAQLSSDQVPHQRTLPISEDIRRQLEESRLRFGIFRLQPALGIRDLGYENNVFSTPTDPVGDWRSTVWAGIRSIVPLGSKIYLRGDVVPQYTYYQKLANRRSLGGSYGASVLGLFNRMTVGAGAKTFRGLAPVSSEVERAALGARTDVDGTIEIDILHRLAVFGAAEEERQRYQSVESSLRALERNESVARAGIRYRFASYLDLSMAAEKSTTDFLARATRNHETRALIVGVHYDRPRTFLNISGGRRVGNSRNFGSTFPRFAAITGSYYASHEMSARILFDAYGNRGIAYSVTVENPYYLETRHGVGSTIPLGRRFAVRAFVEKGRNDYPNLIRSIKRIDDVATYGGGVAFRFYRNVAFVALASNTKYESSYPGQNRSILRVTTSISTQGGFQ